MASFYKDSRQVYRVRELDRLEWLEHGFGTRQSERWLPGDLVTLRQIHSDVCVCVDGATGPAGEGDALATATPARYLAIRTADCLPILLVDERRRAVAAVHAGWRGTAKRISARVVETLAERFYSRPEDLFAAIGPGICGRCYTVGPEVAREFASWFPELAGAAAPATVNLAEANRRQLMEAGVAERQIFVAPLCTFCGPSEDFHSYRRGPDRTGRMTSAVAIRKSPK
jgi:YfiH family protein